MDGLKRAGILFVAFLICLGGCASDEEQKVLHLQKGNEYLQKGALKSAEAEFRQAVRIDPDWPPVLEQLGEVYLRLGNLKDAFEAYRKIERVDPDNLAVQLRLANFYLLSHQVDQAREKVAAVLQKDPHNAEALILSGTLYEQEKKWDQALDAYRLVEGSAGQKASAYVGMGRILARQGNLAEAEALLNRAVAADPESVQLRLLLYEFHVKRRQLAKAEAELQKALALEPENPDLYLILGQFFMLSQAEDQAEKAYQQAIGLAPESIKPLIFAGNFYQQTGRDRSALAMYEKALDLKPSDPGVVDVIAKFYLERQDYAKARHYIFSALDKWPGHFQTRMLYGQLLVMENRFQEAVDLFDALLREEPDAVSVLVHQGIAHVGLKEYDRAREVLKKALALSPGHLQARMMLAKISFLEQDYARAARESREVLAMADHHFEAALLLGNARLRQGRFEAAAEAFGRLTAIDPKNPVGHYRLGVLDRLRGRSADALAHLERALSLNPFFLDAFVELIGIQVDQQAYDAALGRCDAHLETLAERPQQKAVVHSIEGDIHRLKADYARAEKAYEAAMRENRNYLRPYLALAEMYRENEELEKAVAQYQAALENDPRQVSPHFLLGVIFDRQGKEDLAERHYRQALAINAGFVPAMNNLAYLLAGGGRQLDEALELAREAREKLPEDPSIADTLGWVYFQQGRFGDAIGEFLASLEKLPGNPTVHYHLGLAYLKAGQKDPAREQLRTALNLSPAFEGAAHAREVLAGL